jgi:peroxiredoxin
MRVFTIAAVMSAFFVAGYVMMARAEQTPSPKAAIGKTAPAFSLTDQDGKTIKLSDYSGKLIVLEWVNPACPIVQRHYAAGTMIGLNNEFKDKGVVWLSINSTDTDDNAADKTWAMAQKVTWPVLSDSSGATGHAYGATNTPGMYVIGTDGNLKYKGAIDNDPQGDRKDGKINYVRQALDETMAGKPVSVPETEQYGCGVKYKD